jgi:hypothetical protein
MTKKKKPIQVLPSSGGDRYPEGIEDFLPEIEKKEEKKNGNEADKKYHDSVRHGRDAGEDLPFDAR